MKRKHIQFCLQSARNIGGDYGDGYTKGLRRYLYGDSIISDEEHIKYLSSRPENSMKKEGYIDGLLAFPPNQKISQ